MNNSYEITTPWKILHNWINKYLILRILYKLSELIYCTLQWSLGYCYRFACKKIPVIHKTHLFLKKIYKPQAHLFQFLREFIINPRATGSVIPSSRFLTREMVSHTLDCKPNDMIIDLGAGTGVVIKSLIKAGIPPKQIIAVEYSPNLADKLRLNFPEVKVIQGNALELSRLIKDHHGVKHIISSLPLRSLPYHMCQGILKQITSVLPKDGKYIQFTYRLKHNEAYMPTDLNLIKRKIVRMNFPPARVDVWQH
ncbi:MAG: methyltransferase domain-containing protein [Pseudomonadota bacterium]